jgi:hypothetical protein
MHQDKDILEYVFSLTEEKVTPKDLLKFAQYILLFIFILFIFSAILQTIIPTSPVFDACKLVLPEIATLIIGFYFGKIK